MLVSPSKNQGLEYRHQPRLGDKVVLPEGQTAILKYVGPIEGKSGEFAGVELYGDYKGKGRHNGMFQGTKYFTTNTPYSGLFISWTKLLNSANNPPLALPYSKHSNNEPSLGSPTATRSSSAMSFASTTRRHQQQQQSGGPLMPPRTPDRESMTSSPTRLNYPRENMLSSVGSIRRPSSIVRSAMLPPGLPNGGRRQLGTHVTSDSNSNDVIGLVSASQRLVFSPSSSSSSSTSSLTSTLTPRDPSEAFRKELTALSSDVEQLNQTVAEKDLIIQQQSQLIKDLETSIVEFQTLSLQYENLQNESNNLYRLNEDKDRKLTLLRTEFDNKRAEFRHTTDSLQDALHSYETENEELKRHMAEYNSVTEQLAELQKMVLELEEQRAVSNTPSSASNNNNNPVTMITDGNGVPTVMDINYFATVENKILERDETINALKEELDELRAENKLRESAGFGGQQKVSDGDNESESVIAELKESLDLIKQQAIDKEIEITVLRKQLSEEKNKSVIVAAPVTDTAVDDKELGVLKQTIDAKNKEIKELKAASRQNQYMEEELKELKYQFGEIKQELTQSKSALVEKEQALNDLKANNNAGGGNSEVDLVGKEMEKGPMVTQEQLDQLKQQLAEESQQRRELENEILAKSVISQKELNELKKELERESKQRKGLEEDLLNRGSLVSQAELDQLKQQLEKESRQRKTLEDEVQRMETVIEDKTLQESLLEKQINNLKKLSLDDGDTGPSTIATSTVIPASSSVAQIDPAAGRSLWCGLCERSGHESIDCPFEGEEF